MCVDVWLQAATLLLLSDGSDGPHFDTVTVFNSGLKSEQNPLTVMWKENQQNFTGQTGSTGLMESSLRK